MTQPAQDRALRGAALVTGGAQRIGREIGLQLARNGWPVVVHCHRSTAEADATALAMRQIGVRAEVVVADLTDVAASEALLPSAAAAIDAPITCLINNASIFQNDRFDRFDPGVFDKHMAVHARAPALLASAMARQSPSIDNGVIVNLLDQKSYNPDPSFYSYGISKYALRGLTETLARTMAPSIRVNGVALGMVLPPPGMTAARATELGSMTPLGKSAEVADVLAAVRFLVESTGVTGEVIRVDSGEHMGRMARYTKHPNKA